jgi:phosphoglycolate phosphatase-like HAD superfamily hydrolase
LFDFDGTLADSLAAIVEVTNRLAPEFGYRRTPPEQIEPLRGLSTRQLIRYSGIPVLKIPALIRRLRAEMKDCSPSIDPCVGIPAVIRQLHASHYPLAIVTSNTPDTVHQFLATHGLAQCFTSIDGGGSLFGKGRLITRCLKRNHFNPDCTVYVGDELRDIKAARFAGIRSIAVTWGFNSQAVLAAAQPDWLIDQPEELGAIADSLLHSP